MNQAALILDTEADKQNGIRPQDVTDGKEYELNVDAEGGPVKVEKRDTKDGKGSFEQYTLELVDPEDGSPKQLRFLFKKHLAPIARAYGVNPAAWAPRSFINVKGVQVQRKGGTYWDVEITA